MLEFAGLNWLAIIVSTALAFGLGAVWYGPLFGQAWLNAIGKKAEDITPTPGPFIISFVSALLTSIVMAAVISSAGLAGLADGVIVGLFMGLGFIATAMASDSAFCGWGLKLYLIQAGYRVVYCVIMGVIIAVW